MLSENLVILGLLIQAAASLRYLIKTLQGHVKPNRVSFLLWTVIPFIAFAAEIAEGVGIQSLMTLMVGISPLSILLASFLNKKSIWKLGSFDFICGALSVLGIVFWYLTGAGNVAIAFSIIADGLAGLPTVVKSYYHPETEDGLLYLATTVGVILTLLTIKNWNFANYGFPVYLIFLNAIIFLLVEFKIGTKSA